MRHLRRLTFAALSVLTLTAAVGCGTSVVPTQAPGMSQAKSTAGITIQGKTRKLGYDWARYQTKLAGKAKPRKMPRQGLRASKVDGREFCAPVYDQGQLGSCTAFAIGKGLREYNQRRDNERVAPLSALWLYYETRVKIDSVNEDSGGTITDGVAVLQEQGAAVETAWPYDIAQFKVKAPAEVYKGATEFKVKETFQIGSLDDVKSTIAAGQPVAFGFLVYQSFTKVGADGVMAMPKPGEKKLGGHAVLAVGYDDSKKSLIVRNSWSEKWGDKGYFYMPYEFVTEQNTGDFWSAK